MIELLKYHVPPSALNYCIQISSTYHFELNLSFNRKSKFGHYKYWSQSNSHTISINRGLNKSLFLVTYIHELAHLDVMLHYGKKAKPHGNEWKISFIKLMTPLLQESIFDPPLLQQLKKHFINPKASLSADRVLWDLLLPEIASASPCVDDIEIGDVFEYKNRVFKKVKSRRTRALCFEAKSGNTYLIPLMARIEVVSN